MSKRKLLQLVTEGLVSGWNDPRLPTLSGLRRRGYPAPAIRDFCKRIGLTKFNSTTDVALLEFEVRDFLNRNSPRRMAVINPLKVVISNWSADPLTHAQVANHPQNPEAGERHVPISAEIWIEREDFMEDPPKKFYRLGPGRHVRLRAAHIIRYTSHDKDSAGNITCIHAEILPGTVGADAPEGVECRAAIHWVDASTGVDAEVRLYDRLFSVEDPDAAEAGFTSVLNPDSLTIVTAKVEPALAEAAPGFACQFERVGYFVSDNIDHQAGVKPVFNRTVALKDSWGKQAGR
jgi:glutaminyl-tRNA synthetase